jgi:hypothetical protein
VLARVDADALDLVIGTWLADRQHPRPSRRGGGRSRSTARRCGCDMRSHVVSGYVGGGSM